MAIVPDGATSKAAVHALVAQAVKPAWQSKKVWMTLIAFAIALYSAYTGQDTDPSLVMAHIATTATILAPILGMILSLAHIEGPARAAAVAAIEMGEGIATPDAPAATTATVVSIDPLTGRAI